MAYAAPPVSRTTYVILGLFLGNIGVHNFYAKRTGIGLCQLLLTFTIVGILITAPWVIVELFVVKNDGYGRRMF